MMRYTCQIVGTGADGSSPCLLASVERLPLYGKKSEKVPTILARCLFNCAEGVSRLAPEHGIKLSAVKKLFLCGASATDAAGLPGLILSLSSLGAPELQVFGPRGVNVLTDAAGALLRRRSPEVVTAALELSAEETAASFELEDPYWDVHAGVLQPRSAEHPVKGSAPSTANGGSGASTGGSGGAIPTSNGANGGSSGSGGSDGTGRKRPRPRWSDDPAQAPPPPSPLPPSPRVLYRCTPRSGDAPAFLVLSCPTGEYVAAARGHALVRRGGAAFAFHFAPAAVVEGGGYALLLSARVAAVHVVVNEAGACRVLHRRVGEQSAALNVLAREVFPLHWELQQGGGEGGEGGVKKDGGSSGSSSGSSESSSDSDSSSDGSSDSGSDSGSDSSGSKGLRAVTRRTRGGARYIQGEPFMRVTLLPREDRGTDTSKVPKTPNVAQLQTTALEQLQSYGLQQERDAALAAYSAAARQQQPPPPPPPPPAPATITTTPHPPSPPPPPPPPTLAIAGDSLVFLGTGCAAPSKSRGSSGLLLRLAARGAAPPLSLLLDAGEGTLGHLRRHFGADGARRVLRGLDGVWVSHHHADHATGLWRVLSERAAGGDCADVSCGGGGGGGGGGGRGSSGSGGSAGGVTGCDSSSDDATSPLKLLPVVAPESVLRWVGACAAALPERLAITPLRFGDPQASALHPLWRLASVPVEHCHESFALVITRRHPTAGTAPTGHNIALRSGGGGGGAGWQLHRGGVSNGRCWPGAPPPPTGGGHPWGPPPATNAAGAACRWPAANGFAPPAGPGAGSEPVFFVYSGDTRPCGGLIAAGAGAEVLVHEATFADDMGGDAVRKRHCTAGEALEVARRMGARAAVLTHFSQRYPRVPGLGEGQHSGAAVAFDGMEVRLAAAAALPAVTAVVCRALARREEEGGSDGEGGKGGGGRGGDWFG